MRVELGSLIYPEMYFPKIFDSASGLTRCVLVSFILNAFVSSLSARNVVLIVADDLSPRLQCYGGQAISPNLDRLAHEGILFQHAYSQATLCMPSRASFLTGLRPEQVGTRDNNYKKSHFRNFHPDIQTLPEYLKKRGYQSIALGKTFHVNDPQSWSHQELHNLPPEAQYALEANREMLIANKAAGKKGWASVGPLVECAEVDDSAYPDGMVTDQAVRLITEMKHEAFFIMVGFDRPHRPFTAPKRYWDLYEGMDGGKFDLLAPDIIPDGVPAMAVKSWKTDPTQPGDMRYQREARERLGYYASISYIDAQVGRIMDALKAAEVDDETLVIFTADHGFHLGENGQWDKSLVFETGCWVPLIVKDPTARPSMSALPQMVELVDIFPTVMDFLGLDAPHTLAGSSLLEYVNNPTAQLDGVALSEALRDARGKNKANNWDGAIEGRSIRQSDYRLNVWLDTGSGEAVGMELYDYSLPNPETRNLVEDPDYRGIRDQLLSELKAQWPTQN